MDAPRKKFGVVAALVLMSVVLFGPAAPAQQAQALVPSASGLEGLESAPQYPSGLTVFNDVIYFSAPVDDGPNGLWSYDGSTFSVVSTDTANPRAFTMFQERLFFVAQTSSDWYLYSWDGSTLTQEAPSGSEVSDMGIYDGKLYLRGNGNNNELVSYDGSTAPVTIADAPPYPSNFRTVGGTLVFTAWHPPGAYDAYTYNGVDAPVQLTFEGANPSGGLVINDLLYFAARDFVEGYSRSIFTFDGSTTPPVAVTSGVNAGSEIFSLGEDLYFSGTVDSVSSVYRWNAGTTTQIEGSPSYAGNFVEYEGSLFFSGYSDGVGSLFEYDGTTVVAVEGSLEDPSRSVVLHDSLYVSYPDGTPSIFRFTADPVIVDPPVIDDSPVVDDSPAGEESAALAATGVDASSLVGFSTLLLILGLVLTALPAARRTRTRLSIH